MSFKRKSTASGLQQSRKKIKIEDPSYEFPPDIREDMLIMIIEDHYEIDSDGEASCSFLFNIMLVNKSWYASFKSKKVTNYLNYIHAKRWEESQGFVDINDLLCSFRFDNKFSLTHANYFAFPKKAFEEERTYEGYAERWRDYSKSKELVPLYLVDFELKPTEEDYSIYNFKFKLYMLPWHQDVEDIQEEFKHSLEPCIKIRKIEKTFSEADLESIKAILMELLQDYYFGDALVVKDILLFSSIKDFWALDERILEVASEKYSNVAANFFEDVSKYDMNGNVVEPSWPSRRRNSFFLGAHQALAILKYKFENPLIPFYSKIIPQMTMVSVDELKDIKNDKEDWLNDNNIRKNFANYKENPKILIKNNIKNTPNHVACVEKSVRIMEYSKTAFNKNIERYNFSKGDYQKNTELWDSEEDESGESEPSSIEESSSEESD